MNENVIRERKLSNDDCMEERKRGIVHAFNIQHSAEDTDTKEHTLKMNTPTCKRSFIRMIKRLKKQRTTYSNTKRNEFFSLRQEGKFQTMHVSPLGL